MIRRNLRRGRPARKFSGPVMPQIQPGNATFTTPTFGAGTTATLTFNTPMVLHSAGPAGYTGMTFYDGTNTRTVVSVAQTNSQTFVFTVSGALLAHAGTVFVPPQMPGLRTQFGGYAQPGNTATS